MSARLAWALAVVTGLVVLADITVTAAYESLGSSHAIVIHGFPFVELAIVGSAAMGALILSRYPRHVIGWLLCITGLTSSISLLAEAYSVWVLDHAGPGTRSMAGVAGWLSSFFGGQVAISLIAILFLIAPDGRLLSRRWRLGIWIPAAGTASCIVASFTISPTDVDVTGNGDDVSTLSASLFSFGFLLISVGLVISLVSLVIRIRRSAGDERRQLGFVAAAAGLLVAGVVLLIVVQLIDGGKQTFLSSGLLFISYAAMPVLLAVAVLRYRLFEIDIIVNRAVVLAVGTAFAGLGYVILVVGVGAAVGSQRGGFWWSLGATAVVALAFQPLRQAVVGLANRLAYGVRATPYLALADFNRTLAETPSSPLLLPAVAEAAGRAVRGATSVASLELDGAEVSSAEWSAGERADVERPCDVPVIADGVRLGGIAVTPRRGHALRNSDLELLQDLADQASQAFRNVATEMRLAEQVAGLDKTTRELADSSRRIIDADDAARVRLEEAIGSEVLPRLTALSPRLANARDVAGAGEAQPELEELIAETNAALESLRDITRGVFPTQLARVGLGAPLRSLLSRQGHGAVLEVGAEAERRFSPRVESAVYFCCAEMLRRSGAPSRITLHVDGGELAVKVDGVDLTRVDLEMIRDRVEAAGGRVADDHATALCVRLPASPAPTTPR